MMFTTPPIIINLVTTLISTTGCNKLFVPLAKGNEIKSLKGITSIDYHCQNEILADSIQRETGIKQINEDEQTGKTYDIVFSDLPFGLVKKGSPQAKIVQDSISAIAENGFAVFTFAEGITIQKDSIKWINELSESGLFVSAIIDLEAGTYAPMTSIPSKVIIFSLQDVSEVFLAKVKKPDNIDSIIDNYIGRTTSNKGDHLGIWFEKNTYKDFTSYESEKRSRRIKEGLKKDYNADLCSIADISTSIILGKENKRFDQIDNAVYIPKIGKSPVYTETESLKLKQHNYFQVILDSEIVLPKFIAFVLNTEKGIELRERAMTGFIPKLNLTTLKSLEIPIPSIDFQEKLLTLEDKLDYIFNETIRVKQSLENKPVAYKNLEKTIRDINNQGDRFEQWVETLPYPLATILRRYLVANSDMKKQESLLHFFEAYSIFEAAILSGAYNRHIVGNIENVDFESFEKASFGNWVTMDKALADRFRSEMNSSKEKKDQILDCFHTDDGQLINALCSKDVCNILFQMVDYRNRWKGHVGVTSELEYQEHVRILKGKTDKFQRYVNDLYEKIRLIRPIELKKKHGQFINTVEILTGSNPIFKKDIIIEDEGLDQEKLYIQALDTKEVFEIPPFFVFSNDPSDAKNACYFYSRLENGGNTKYISYHFENKSKDIEAGITAYTIIKDILCPKSN